VAVLASRPEQVVVQDTDAMRRLLTTWSKGEASTSISDLALDVLRSKYATPEGVMLKTDLELLAARTAMVAVHSAALRDVFVLLDTQETGVVSTEALAEMLAAVGHTEALPEIEEVCAIGDVDCDGGLDFEELCMMARTGALDLAELLAFRELKMGAPQMGVPRSKRAMLLLDASRQQLRKQWAELAPAPTKPQMIETPIAAMPTPTVEDSNDVSASGEPVVSPVVEAAAAEAAVTAAFGVVTEVDTKEGLAAVINANPGKMVCLMIGFTFCRPCKAFVRPYEKVAAHYNDVLFLKMMGNSSDDTMSFVRDTLLLKVSPMFYFFRGGPDTPVFEPVHRQSGARDYKLVASMERLLQPDEIPASGHYPTAGAPEGIRI